MYSSHVQSIFANKNKTESKIAKSIFALGPSTNMHFHWRSSITSYEYVQQTAGLRLFSQWELVCTRTSFCSCCNKTGVSNLTLSNSGAVGHVSLPLPNQIRLSNVLEDESGCVCLCSFVHVLLSYPSVVLCATLHLLTNYQWEAHNSLSLKECSIISTFL